MSQSMKTLVFLLGTVLACVAGPVRSGSAVVRTTPPESAVDAIFAGYDAPSTPGCSVAVVDGGKVLLKKSYGMADIALGVPMSSSTSSWIPYSEGRVFVALAVAMLARDGKISLDDPVRRHVPELPGYASAVTVRHLLHHDSGLADYGTLLGPGWSLGDRVSEDELLRVLARWNRLEFEAGRGHMYSNTDYALLKMLVERASGLSLHGYLDRELLAPLGMASTRIGADQADVYPGHALFHEADGAGFRRLLRYRVSPVGGISVTTSLDDLLRFDAALRDPATGLAAMLDGLGDETSFGRSESWFKGLRLVQFHGVGGFNYLVQVHDTALSVATLCNAYAGMATMGADVARLFVSPANPELPSASTAPESGFAISAAELQRYAGEYRTVDGTHPVDVSVVDGKLAITPRGQPSFPDLVAVGDGQFETTLGGSKFRLSFRDGGSGMTLSSWDVGASESGGPTLNRWSSWRPEPESLGDYAGTYVGENVEVVLHVRADEERLLLATRGLPESVLEPSDTPDEFRLPETYGARFARDAAGRVVAILLDASRIQGIRFRREASSPPAGH